MKGRDERVLLSNAAHSKGFDRRLGGGGGGRLSRFFYAGKERRRRRSLFFFFKVIIGSLELMFRNVVWSRCRRPAAFVSLSRARVRRRATREERRSSPDFFVALVVRIEPEERRRTTLEERHRCRSCVSTFQSKRTTTKN